MNSSLPLSPTKTIQNIHQATFLTHMFASTTKTRTQNKRGTEQTNPTRCKKLPPQKKTSSETRQFDEHLQSSAAMDSSLRLISRGARINTKCGKNHMSNGKRDLLVVYRVYIGGMKSCPVMIRGSTNGKQDMVKATCAIKVGQLLILGMQSL